MTTKINTNKLFVLGNRNVCLTIIFILTFFIFSNTLQNKLTTWDDDKYITENALIKESSAENIKSIITQPYFDNYSPLHLLMYMAEYKLFGTKAFGYHFFSIVLHCINAILVFLLLFKLSKNQLHAFFAALIFAIHPLRTESVAWASEQKDLLFAFFYLLALLQYLHSLQIKGSGRYLLTILWFTLALLSKSAAVTLPLVLLLLDFYQNKLIRWDDIRTKIPFFLLSLFMGIVTIYAQKEEALVENPYLNLAERLPIACFALTKYVWQNLFPIDLCAFYPYPDKINDHLPFWYWLFLIPVVTLIYFVVKKKFYKHPIIIFYLLFFIFTILPTLQLIPVGSAMMADRYSYLPSIGISMLLVILGEKFFHRFSLLQNKSAYLGSILLFILAFATVKQNKIWKNSMTLYNHILGKHPNLAVFYNNRGAIKIEEQDFNGALDDYNSAIRSDAGFYLTYYNLGNFYKDKKEYETALQNYKKSILLKPSAKGYHNRGVVYAMQKNYEAAISDFDIAIGMNKNYGLAYKNRGLAYIYTNQKDRGCADFLESVNLGNESAQKHFQNFCRVQ